MSTTHSVFFSPLVFVCYVAALVIDDERGSTKTVGQTSE